MTIITYGIPPEEDPEPGAPARIEHGCDYMLSPDGTVEFYYNFLDYYWVVDGETVRARAYLDETQNAVTVFVAGTRLREEGVLQPLVRYLQRRFTQIKSSEPDDIDGDPGTGYRLVFQHRRYQASS